MIFSNIFTQNLNTTYITKAIHLALNKKVNTGLVVDGKWGSKTTDAVIKFRKAMKYKNHTGMIGAGAFRELFK